MRILIEIQGGCVSNVAATESVEIVIVDHDNMKEGDVNTCKQIYGEDEILSKEDMKKYVEKMVKKHG